MLNKEFAKTLEQRTLDFSIDVIKLSATISNSTETKIVRNQITKCATSIGANYREANRSRSRADFRNKIKICESEASETQYWLLIISRMEWAKPEYLNRIYNECSELLALFTKIAKSTNAD